MFDYPIKTNTTASAMFYKLSPANFLILGEESAFHISMYQSLREGEKVLCFFFYIFFSPLLMLSFSFVSSLPVFSAARDPLQSITN